jgi:hypothetical protein
MSADKVLIVNEDLCYGPSTNAQLYWSTNTQAQVRKRSLYLNGTLVCSQDFIIPEFTQAEAKTLKRVQRYSNR